MGEYIPQLKHLIKTARLQEAREALADLASRPQTDQEAVIELLALASDSTALDLLGFLTETTSKENPLHLRLFQLTSDRAHINSNFVRILINSGTPAQMRQITPLLKHILTKEAQGDLLNRILRVVGKFKLEALIDDVAEFIFYDDPTLKQESVKALERMATPKALERLKQIAKTDKCDLDILDAIDVLEERLEPMAPAAETAPVSPVPFAPQPPESAPQPPPTPEPAPAPQAAAPSPPAAAPPVQTEPSDELSDKLFLLASKRLQDRHQAYLYFCEHGDMVARALKASLDSKDTDLMINLLRLTARTIPQKAVSDLLTLAGKKDLERPLKFSVYSALAHLPELESAASVVSGTSDTSMHIRIAALHALDRHCSDFVIAEIKKKIESGTKVGEAIGVSILDAKATRLIDALMDSDTFSYIISNYLERGASLQVLDAYISVLEQRKRVSSVKKHNRLRLEQAKKERPFFVVIHPSEIYLSVYAKLIHSCGFDARTFVSPQEAFESIVFEKPAAVVCDLFIKELTALDLAREIREIYPRDEVPIIVSSLQKNLDKTLMNHAFDEAGINGFYDFPAKISQIKTWAAAK
ncbi:MAG: hypothetical protein MI802_00565 [Desulfobacterales bacterium]|nr:hypothetical protein [Desulfobacterales bacterium]